MMVIAASPRSSPSRTAAKGGFQHPLGTGAVAPATALRCDTESSARFRLPRLTRRGKGQPGEGERQDGLLGRHNVPPRVMALRRRVIVQGMTDAMSSHTGVMSPQGYLTVSVIYAQGAMCVGASLIGG